MSLATNIVDERELATVIGAIDAATGLETVGKVIEAQIKAWGFGYFTYILVRPLMNGDDTVHLSNFPEAWQHKYRAGHYRNIDPVLQHGATTSRPFLWNDVKGMSAFTAEQRQLFQEAASHGLRSGGSVPLHGPGIARAQLTIADAADDERFKVRFAARCFSLQLMAGYLHDRVLSLSPASIRAALAIEAASSGVEQPN